MSNVLNFGPLSISKLEVESRKGLFETMADVAESEGDLESAAYYYMEAAKFQAHSGDDRQGLSVYVAYLIHKATKLRETLTIEHMMLEG